MKAGQLRHRITFEAPTPSRDGYGQNVPTWTAVATTWAAIKPMTGRQLALAQADTTTATATHQITIRYRNNIKVGYHRIRYGAGPEAATPSEDFMTLTLDQFQTLDLDESESDSSEEPEPRIFRINSILDTDERHRELVLIVTEVVA